MFGKLLLRTFRCFVCSSRPIAGLTCPGFHLPRCGMIARCLRIMLRIYVCYILKCRAFYTLHSLYMFVWSPCYSHCPIFRSTLDEIFRLLLCTEQVEEDQGIVDAELVRLQWLGLHLLAKHMLDSWWWLATVVVPGSYSWLCERPACACQLSR